MICMYIQVSKKKKNVEDKNAQTKQKQKHMEANVIHPQARQPIQNEIKSLNFVWGVSPGGVSRLGVDYVI